MQPSRVKLSHTEDAPHNPLHYIFENLPWEFVVRICQGYLPREFAAEFTVAICHGFFVFVTKYFLHMCANLVYMEANLFFL